MLVPAPITCQARDCPPTTHEPYRNILIHALADTETLRVLLEGGANPNAVPYCTEDAGAYPLISAIRAYPEQVELSAIRTLLNFGADPDRHTDEEAQIPLLMAVQHNDPALVRLLLSAGADANVLPIKRSRACRTPEQYSTALDRAQAACYRNPNTDSRTRRNQEAVIQGPAQWRGTDTQRIMSLPSKPAQRPTLAVYR
ncbi:MAG: ankyrin repeat domain-containing protein [Thiolinea sp.]